MTDVTYRVLLREESVGRSLKGPLFRLERRPAGLELLRASRRETKVDAVPGTTDTHCLIVPTVRG